MSLLCFSFFLFLYNSDWLSDALLGIFDYGTFGGQSFVDSLTHHLLDPSRSGNTFEYLLGGNILSYAIKERTRMTPEEFAQTQIFPLLGIQEQDYLWQKNREGVSFAWHGMFMTVWAMAKLGMLYLQHSTAKAVRLVTWSNGISCRIRRLVRRRILTTDTTSGKLKSLTQNRPLGTLLLVLVPMPFLLMRI